MKTIWYCSKTPFRDKSKLQHATRNEKSLRQLDDAACKVDCFSGETFCLSRSDNCDDSTVWWGKLWSLARYIPLSLRFWTTYFLQKFTSVYHWLGELGRGNSETKLHLAAIRNVSTRFWQNILFHEHSNFLLSCWTLMIFLSLMQTLM